MKCRQLPLYKQVVWQQVQILQKLWGHVTNITSPHSKSGSIKRYSPWLCQKQQLGLTFNLDHGKYYIFPWTCCCLLAWVCLSVDFKQWASFVFEWNKIADFGPPSRPFSRPLLLVLLVRECDMVKTLQIELSPGRILLLKVMAFSKNILWDSGSDNLCSSMLLNWQCV